jgi:hypothetical protein
MSRALGKYLASSSGRPYPKSIPGIWRFGKSAAHVLRVDELNSDICQAGVGSRAGGHHGKSWSWFRSHG